MSEENTVRTIIAYFRSEADGHRKTFKDTEGSARIYDKWVNALEAREARIAQLEAELEKTRAMVLAEQERYGQCTANEKRLEEENARLASALEKIADKRKRDHQEPDAYTELGCVMNIAHQALEGRGGK